MRLIGLSYRCWSAAAATAALVGVGGADEADAMPCNPPAVGSRGARPRPRLRRRGARLCGEHGNGCIQRADVTYCKMSAPFPSPTIKLLSYRRLPIAHRHDTKSPPPAAEPLLPPAPTLSRAIDNPQVVRGQPWTSRRSMRRLTRCALILQRPWPPTCLLSARPWWPARRDWVPVRRR